MSYLFQKAKLIKRKKRDMNTQGSIYIYLKILFITAVFIVVTMGCKEEKLPLWSGENYLSFSYMADHKQQEKTFNFATDAPLEAEAYVGINLSLLGNLPNEDFEYKVSIRKMQSNNEDKSDSEKKSGIFHKGLAEDVFKLLVSRDKELLETHYTLEVTLMEATDKIIAPEEFKSARIKVVDKVEKPTWWAQSQASKLGDYYPIKYRLFIIYMDGAILNNLDEYTGIEFANLIGNFKLWWQNKWENGEYHYYLKDGSTPMYESILD